MAPRSMAPGGFNFREAPFLGLRGMAWGLALGLAQERAPGDFPPPPTSERRPAAVRQPKHLQKVSSRVDGFRGEATIPQ
jgi:hypothetical protein